MDSIKFYQPPLNALASGRAASRFPACREAAVAPQRIPHSGITLGGKQRGPTAAADAPLLRIGRPKDTISASCGAIRSNDNCIEHDNHQRTEEPLPVVQSNRPGASSQSQADDDIGPGGNVSTSKSDSQASDHSHDEIASTKSRKASKGKTRRARDLLVQISLTIP